MCAFEMLYMPNYSSGLNHGRAKYVGYSTDIRERLLGYIDHRKALVCMVQFTGGVDNSEAKSHNAVELN